MKLEDGLIAADALTKKGGTAIIKNTGKIIAVITLIVATLLTFADVALSSFQGEEFTATLVVMLIASYLMYFSLEDAGEKLGLEGEDYVKHKAAFDEVKARISGEDIPSLRDFCNRYTADEIKFRQRCLLLEVGYTEAEYTEYLGGGSVDKKRERAFKRVKRLKSATLTPATLLLGGSKTPSTEIYERGKFKFLRMGLKLIPTAVCTVVTVSVILTVKDGLTPSDIAESILKLSSLPIIGCRGYLAGYNFVKGVEIPILDTKRRIIEAYLSEKAEKDYRI